MKLKTPVDFGLPPVSEGKDLYVITEFYYNEELKQWRSLAYGGVITLMLSPKELDTYLWERQGAHRKFDPTAGGLLDLKKSTSRLRVRKVTVLEEGYIDL